ncbi:hypothetical protein REH65_31185 [Saccharopolyspora sp. ID03-671]|uniref:hypothetical protein n=1 Tax=Saccharopolyspora sp. ID03-671 TaxID=3073066 RepID=UPI00324A15CC
MRFRAVVVFARLCGAAGLGVFLGSAVAGLISIVTGTAFARGAAWVTGVPVLAVLGALAGLAIAWITRRWFVPQASHRRLLFTAAGVAALPLAVGVAQGEPSIPVAFTLIAAAVMLTVTLWVRGYRRETAQVRAMMYGYGRPAGR